MSKRGELNKLFEEWKQQKFLFCEDGIICEDIYNDITTLKPLFVLKDVHNETVTKDELCDDGINIDMRKAVLKPGQEKTWKPIAYWTEALTQKDPKEFQSIQSLNVLETLRKCAFLNIKKDEGGASVCGDVLLKYAKRDKELIKRQICICEPDVIIVCGEDVFACIEEVYAKRELTFVKKIETLYETRNKTYGEIYRLNTALSKAVYVIKYQHPNRTAHEKTYNDMLKFRQFIDEVKS